MLLVLMATLPGYLLMIYLKPVLEQQVIQVVASLLLAGLQLIALIPWFLAMQLSESQSPDILLAVVRAPEIKIMPNTVSYRRSRCCDGLDASFIMLLARCW